MKYTQDRVNDRSQPERSRNRKLIEHPSTAVERPPINRWKVMEGEAKVPASPPEVMLGASHLNVPFIHHGSSSRILSIRSFRLLVTPQFQTLCLTAVTVSVHYITRCTTGEGCA